MATSHNMNMSAIAYHLATSYDRHRMQGHFLDWQNQPHLYKKYPGIEPVPLERQHGFPERSLWDLLAERSPPEQPHMLDLKHLSAIFFLTSRITAQSRHGSDIFYYRSTASAGALYPNEIYVTAYDIKGLEKGLYHYDLKDMALSPLRKGDLSSTVAETVRYGGRKQMLASFWISGIFFRSAWKYRARAFRYTLLDAGHMLQNLIFALKHFRFEFDVGYDFDDDKANLLLGIDGQREACLAAVLVFGNQTATSKKSSPIARLGESYLDASRMSACEAVYPEAKAAYLSGRTEWKALESSLTPPNAFTPNPAKWRRLNLDQAVESEMSYGQAVLRRRSKRNFIRQPISRARFDRLLSLITRTSVQDRPTQLPHAASPRLGLVLQGIDGLKAGIYLLDTTKRAIGPVCEGGYSVKMATACLGQAWLGNAAVQVVFLSDIEWLENTLGPRSYRYAMLDAGRMGQALYIGSTALGLGCCGIGAFYDEDARQVLALSRDTFMLYLVAAGRVKGS